MIAAYRCFCGYTSGFNGRLRLPASLADRWGRTTDNAPGLDTGSCSTTLSYIGKYAAAGCKRPPPHLISPQAINPAAPFISSRGFYAQSCRVSPRPLSRRARQFINPQRQYDVCGLPQQPFFRPIGIMSRAVS